VETSVSWAGWEILIQDPSEMSPDQKNVWWAWFFRTLWLLYTLLLIAIAYFNNTPLGKIFLSIFLGTGGWIGVYWFIVKEDLVFFSHTLKHEEHKILRLMVLCFVLITLYQIPGGLQS